MFDGRPNVFATPQGGDLTGITRVANSFGTDVDVAYRADARLSTAISGSTTTELAPSPSRPSPRKVSTTGRSTAPPSPTTPRPPSSAGTTARSGPSTLRPGQTRYVRLDFHQATCDPAALQDGSSRVDSLPVRYRILGRTRTIDVPFDQVTIAVKTTGICDRPV